MIKQLKLFNSCLNWVHTVSHSHNRVSDRQAIPLNPVGLCKSSITGKLLAKSFPFLLMDYKLGINSKWLSTTDNYIADEVSRLKSCMHLLLNNFPLTIPHFDRSIFSWRTAVSFNRHQTCSPVSGTYCCTRSWQVSIMWRCWNNQVYARSLHTLVYF